MKRFVKISIITILIIFLIFNSVAVYIYAGCFIDKITQPNQPGWAEMDSATGWALYTIMFIVIEVILLIAIIRLFAKRSAKAEINNTNGDDYEKE